MNKLLVITGGSKGIGLATCEQFLQHGYRVLSLSRSPHPLAEVEYVTTDLSDPEWLNQCTDVLSAEVSGAQQLVLVHNAAVTRTDTTEILSSEDMQRVMQLNVIAAIQLNGLLLPQMSTGSSILYVGSTLSEKAVPNACSYVVSKHAQLGLMRTTCQDLMGRGVHTAMVCPGFTDTQMLRAHIGHDDEVLRTIAAGNAYDRLVKPSEIAETLLFCARNPVLNGSVIHANLGQKES